MLIYGTGSSAEKLTNLLNFEEVDIVAYVDSNKEKAGSTFMDRTIISPDYINSFESDYIFIASQYYEEIIDILKKNNVDLSKVINLKKDFLDSILYELDLDLCFQQFSDQAQQIELLATGLSYVRDGLNLSVLHRKGFNFAFSSQDLYCDYLIVKEIFNDYELKNLKYLLIGLAYYSFDYDLSKSINSYLVPRYYKLAKSNGYYHFENDYLQFRKVVKPLIKKPESTINEKLLNRNLYFQKLSEIEKINGKSTALRHSKKNYPDTVRQNKYYLSEMLKLAKQKNVKPIIVVFPTSEYYHNYISKDMELKFYNIIYELKEDNNFIIFDYFRNSNFENDDFYDASHLNYNGAKKFTKILNSLLLDV